MSVRSSDGKNFRRVARTAGDRVPAAGIRRNKAFYTATGGELSLDLQTLTPQISYQPGQAQLEVKSSAGPMIEGLDYYETSSTSISFPSPGLSAGEILEIIQAFQYSGNLVAQVRPDEYSEVATAGQTSVTTDFSWPLNQNPAKRHGAIMVYVNGILQQRGASQDYVEMSLGQANTNQIQFNSALAGGENISIVRAHQAIDETAASTQFNNTRLAELQEHFTKGFQAMVDESSTVVAPYTTVINRARIPDIANDLKVSFGIDRVPIQDLYLISNEFGSNKETVFGAKEDDRGLVRFIGRWFLNIDRYGQRPYTDSVNSYCEITFYGTGLNILVSESGSKDFSALIDGAASYGPNLMPVNYSGGLIQGQNYSGNAVFAITNTLSLGVHTIKIRNNSVNGFGLAGFEVLNSASSTSLKVNPGYAFANGRKISSLTGSSSMLAKPVTVTGGRGGRVVAYANPDGSFGQSVQLTGSFGSLLSADHSIEEMVRAYHFREFGSSRNSGSLETPDDFSVQTTTTSTVNRYFVLDDGTTSLASNATLGRATGGPNNGEYALFPETTTEIMFTFVGTGVDVECITNTSFRDCDVFIDGTTLPAGTISKAANTPKEVIKLFSGLKYGTHTLRIKLGPSGASLGIVRFFVYQPKKPSIPTGAIELADYNVLGDYTGATVGGAYSIAEGVLRKSSVREFVYAGSAWTSSLNSPANVLLNSFLGPGIYSGTNGDYIEYWFFGTGFEWRFTTPGAASVWQILIDGATNLTISNSSPTAGTAGWTGSVSTNSSYYGGGVSSWVANTGTIYTTVSAAYGNGIKVSGLNLGLHFVRITKTGGGGQISNNALDIITPIYSTKTPVSSLQNALTVGSCSLSDSRKTSLVKSEKPKKGWAQTLGIKSSPPPLNFVTTTATEYVPCGDMSVTVKTNGGLLQISYSISLQKNDTNGEYTQIFVNGVPVGREKFSTVAATYTTNHSDVFVLDLPAGVYKVDLYWKAGTGGTVTASTINRNLLAVEL